MANTWTSKDLESDDRPDRGPSEAQVSARNQAIHLDAAADEILRQISGLTKAEALELAKIRGA